jgi:choline dehydrogenase
MQADNLPGMTLCSCPLRPASRGHVHIQTPEASDHPAIQLGYLDRLEDQRLQIAGLRLGRALAAHPVLQAHIEDEIAWARAGD